MPERKSSRSRKVVDNAKFTCDIDDDFVENSPHGHKKQKMSHKEIKENKMDKSDKNKDTKSKSKPQDDLVFECELQEALNLSISHLDAVQELTSAKETTDDMGPPIINIENQDDISPILAAIGNPPILSRISAADDKIEVLQANIDIIPSSRKRVSAKKYVDSDSESENGDSDFALVGEEDNDEDDSDESYSAGDSDNDFGSSKSKMKKKSTKRQLKKKVGKANVSHEKSNTKPGTTTMKSVSLPVQTSHSMPTLVCRSPTTSNTPRKPPNWKPPSLVNDEKSPVISVSKNQQSNSIKSPSSGLRSDSQSPLCGSLKSPNTGLRLGLSRNIRLKPLHPNLKIKN